MGPGLTSRGLVVEVHLGQGGAAERWAAVTWAGDVWISGFCQVCLHLGQCQRWGQKGLLVLGVILWVPFYVHWGMIWLGRDGTGRWRLVSRSSGCSV